MGDIDLSLDFGDFGGFGLDEQPEPRFLDVHSIVLAGEAPRRVEFSVSRERAQAEAVLHVPEPGCRLECISGRLGFSSIAVIDAVAQAEPVDELCAATFNVSRERMRHLERLHREGRISDGLLLTSDVKSGRDPYPREACARMGWGFREMKNHAKLILMRTASGFHCVRTSSNLNENPRIETYTWDNCERTWEFYRSLFEAVFGR